MVIRGIKKHVLWIFLLNLGALGIWDGGLIQKVAAQSAQTWKTCGKPDGSDNATCPTCSGTCKMTATYKICQDTGTGCTMPAANNGSCAGDLYDGGADGKDCDGTKFGSCQYSIKKCT